MSWALPMLLKPFRESSALLGRMGAPGGGMMVLPGLTEFVLAMREEKNSRPKSARAGESGRPLSLLGERGDTKPAEALLKEVSTCKLPRPLLPWKEEMPLANMEDIPDLAPEFPEVDDGPNLENPPPTEE